jgi:hypothetical protein
MQQSIDIARFTVDFSPQHASACSRTKLISRQLGTGLLIIWSLGCLVLLSIQTQYKLAMRLCDILASMHNLIISIADSEAANLRLEIQDLCSDVSYLQKVVHKIHWLT